MVRNIFCVTSDCLGHVPDLVHVSFQQHRRLGEVDWLQVGSPMHQQAERTQPKNTTTGRHRRNQCRRQIMTDVAACCKHDRSMPFVVGRRRQSGLGEKRKSIVDGPVGCAMWMSPSPLCDPICARNGHGTSLPLVAGRTTEVERRDAPWSGNL